MAGQSLWILGWALALLLAACSLWLGVLCAYWRRLSLTDDTSGLFNRRYLFRRLPHELCRARAASRPVALLVLEVDDMKRCNDQHGHLAGDALLGAVAGSIRAAVRRDDVVARWGGDEFAVILPGATVAEALTLAERIRRSVAALAVDDGRGGVVCSTVSVGVAVGLEAARGPLEALDRADRAMYVAKRRKNRVELAT
jgi:diguanylate cyclase (GGDEF)-like protein